MFHPFGILLQVPTLSFPLLIFLSALFKSTSRILSFPLPFPKELVISGLPEDLVRQTQRAKRFLLDRFPRRKIRENFDIGNFGPALRLEALQNGTSRRQNERGTSSSGILI
jgi:hypothetical protein